MTIIDLIIVMVGFVSPLKNRAAFLARDADGVVDDTMVRTSCFNEVTVGVVVAEITRMREEVRTRTADGVVASNTDLR